MLPSYLGVTLVEPDFGKQEQLSFDFHNVKFQYITSIYLLLDTKLFLVHIKIIYGFFRVLIFN